MALGRLFAWLRKPPSVENDEERIAKLMRGLSSNDPDARVYAQRTLLMIIHNRHLDYSDAYIIRVLEVLSEQGNLLDYPWILRQVEVLSEPPTPYNVSEDIPVAARVCKHRLRDRYEPGYSAKTLLHPASNPMSKDELLRPASGSPETHPETLLRAVDSEKPGSIEEKTQ